MAEGLVVPQNLLVLRNARSNFVSTDFPSKVRTHPGCCNQGRSRVGV